MSSQTPAPGRRPRPVFGVARRPVKASKALASPPPSRRQFFRNLIAVLVVGVLISVWLHSFTDLFPALVTGLGLGGVLTWAGFVLGLVPEARRQPVHEWVAASFDSVWPERVALGLFFVAVLVSGCCGAVRLENLQAGDALVQVYSGDQRQENDDERLGSGAEHNFPAWMWLWSTAPRQVKALGLPTQEVEVRPWWRARGAERLQVPGSFLRPLVLIGPEPRVLADADPAKHELQVLVNGDTAYAAPYSGRALLFGTKDDDLPLPATLGSYQGWKDMMDRPDTVVKLFPADVALPHISGKKVTLRAADEVVARVINKSSRRPVAATMPLKLSQPHDRAALITPMLLHP